MSFDKEQLKSRLVRDKAFLRALYVGPNPLKNRRLIFAATDSQLDTLIKFIFYVCNGEISIDTSDFQAIKKKKKLSFLKRNFEDKNKIDEILFKELEFKKDLLLKLSPVYPNLLSTLFVLPNKESNGI
jgi:hypothetical protein